jgi:hypothetical protein
VTGTVTAQPALDKGQGEGPAQLRASSIQCKRLCSRGHLDSFPTTALGTAQLKVSPLEKQLSPRPEEEGERMSCGSLNRWVAFRTLKCLLIITVSSQQRNVKISLN